MPYSFHSEKIKFTLQKKARLSKWISTVIRSEKKKAGDIAFIFCSDTFLLRLNRQFLGHNTLTDIITFDYSADKLISGEIYISIPRVKENAKKFRMNFEQELHRVMIHGVLHLLGYKDKTKKAKEEMRKMEDKCLRKLR